MSMNREIYFLLFFVGTVILAIIMTRIVIRLALRFNIVDSPDQPRKIHSVARPKLGGLAIFLTFVIGVGELAMTVGTGEISGRRLFGVILGGLFLLIGGVLDDKYNLRPSQQIWFPVFAALAVVVFGNHLSLVTNPLGGAFVLDQAKLWGYPILGSILVFAWVLGMIYTTKFLDGMDGLVSGVSVIAGLVIFALALKLEVGQTTNAFLALIFAATCLGFLFFNFHPAKIFLGEAGSTLTGFFIAVLAVVSGAKIASALLVLGIPVLDVAWVIVQRLWLRSSPFVGDNKHLHFRLLDIGLSQRKTVLFLYLLAAAFGGVAVFLQSGGKLLALLVLG